MSLTVVTIMKERREEKRGKTNIGVGSAVIVKVRGMEKNTREARIIRWWGRIMFEFNLKMGRVKR